MHTRRRPFRGSEFESFEAPLEDFQSSKIFSAEQDRSDVLIRQAVRQD